VRPIKPFCPDDPIWTAPKMAIDVHAHVFNATDLPIRTFVSRVLIRQDGVVGVIAELLASVLADLTWAASPSVQEEDQKLANLSDQIKQCSRSELPAELIAAREEKYSAGVRELRAVADKKLSQRAFAVQPFGLGRVALTSGDEREAALQSLKQLPPTYQGFVELQEGSEGFTIQKVSIGSLWAFIIEMFQYRYTCYHNYLQSYSTGQQRSIDLTVAALVDYDWWLTERGAPTPSSLPRQVDLMSRLAVATSGRLHYWAPFCPLRELMYQKGRGKFSSLALVQQAVRNGGAIGIKMYPPMGFAPLGNAGLGKNFWAQGRWLPDITRQNSFGFELDGVLRKLYRWCEDEQVPILAHSSASNGPNKAFEALATAEYWEFALREFPGLRVNFGHFGGAGDPKAEASAEHFLRLMHAETGPGNSAYADASYVSEILEDQTALSRTLQVLFDSSVDKERVLGRRFMFGTDWKMLLMERGARSYFERFEVVASILGGALQSAARPEFPDAFFAGNAVNYLGLGSGGRARERLDSFYGRYGVANVEWRRKI